MYTERGGGGWLNSLAREEGRVALAGVGLVFLHTAGTRGGGGGGAGGSGRVGLVFLHTAFIEEPLVVTVIRKMTLIVKTSTNWYEP